MEGDDKVTDILDSLKECHIGILQEIRIILELTQRSVWRAVLTLTHDITLQRLGAPIRTIPIMLSTSIQNIRYTPSNN